MNLIFKSKFLWFFLIFLVTTSAQAGSPLWTIIPLSATNHQIAANGGTIVVYRVTNQSKRPHSLVMKPIPGVSQLNLGSFTCSSVFTLASKQSCTLVLLILGRNLQGNINDGPVLCESGSNLQCYRPSQANLLNISPQSDRSRTVGGVLSGLIGTVVLQNNSSDTLPLSGDGLFVFPDMVAPGCTYNVTVLTQPSGQTCTVNNGSGTIGVLPIRNVRVTCSANTHSVGGTITGLTGTVVLLNNGANPLSQNTIGAFTFPPPDLAEGSTYNVTVQTQPTGETCSVSNGNGTIGTTDVTTVNVTCSVNTFSIGGNITGPGGTVSLMNNGSEIVNANENSPYTFTGLADQSSYNVTVNTQPPGQFCQVANATGTISGANVNNINVTCNSSQVSLTAAPNAVIPVSAGMATVAVTNTSTTDTALNVRAVLPSGWVDVTQVPCATILPNQTCDLEFTTSTPYVAQGNILITGDNVSTPATTALAFSINGYLVFSVDSTTSASVVDTTPFPNVQWSDENGSLVGADSFTDGQSNTLLIVNDPNIGVTAAASCYNSTQGGATAGTWYLPAICQLGTGSIPTLCPQNFPTIDTLEGLGFAIPNNVYLWSSTEAFGFDPTIDYQTLNAWVNYSFGPEALSFQTITAKSNQNGPLCTRSMPY